MTNGKVTISRDHYDALILDHQRLTALDAASPLNDVNRVTLAAMTTSALPVKEG